MFKTFGSSSPTRYCSSQLPTQGMYDEADPLYLRALEMGENTLGSNHPALATRLNNRAESLSIFVLLYPYQCNSSSGVVFFCTLQVTYEEAEALGICILGLCVTYS